MRIVIDLQSIQSESRYRGIGRYSYALARAMAENARDHEIWLALSAAFPETIPEIRHNFINLIPVERIRVFSVPLPAAQLDTGNAWRVRAAELVREHFLHQLNPDFLHISSLFESISENAVTSAGLLTSGTDTAITLYDLIPLMNEETYLPTRILKEWYQNKIQSLKAARILFSISEHSKREAVSQLNISTDNIINISAAVDERFRKITISALEIKRMKTQYGISRKIILYVPGGFDSRKNFDGLIKSFSALPQKIRRDHQLVIASKSSQSNLATIKELARQASLDHDELIITGYVPDDDLVKLYNLASLFVFPSKNEGFGLPVLEAMSCGLATIGSNTTSIPEVIGMDDALFDPNSIGSMTEKMAKVLSDKQFREHLSEHGLERARHFSWKKTAKIVLDAFEREAEHRNTVSSSKIFFSSESSYRKLLDSLKHIEANAAPSDLDLAKVAQSVAFNSGPSSKRQLHLDVSTIIHEDARSGIQRVVRGILTELVNFPPKDIEVKLIYFTSGTYFIANKFLAELSNLPNKENDSVAEFYQDDIYLALDLNMHLAVPLLPVHTEMRCIGVYMFYIVYDILLVKHPEWWPSGLSTLFENWLSSISQTATGLVCISHSVAEEVKEWLEFHLPQRADPLVIKSFHLGADVANSLPTMGMPEDAETLLEYFGSKPSFLMVGTLEPRKGHDQVLSAFELLWKKGYDINLVIVGKQGWMVDSLVKKIETHVEFGKRLFWLHGISDEYLGRLYTTSRCLIAASEGEGFGLPLIEASQNSLPIIARDLPVFKEVAGTHAVFFTGLELEPLADTILSWLGMYENQLVPSSKDLPWLTWRQSAEQLLSAILPLAPASDVSNIRSLTEVEF